MDTYANIKKQTYIMPDGSTAEITSAKDYTFVVVTADPEYRILQRCTTLKYANERLAYYQHIWAGEPLPLLIVKRSESQFIYRQETP